MTVVFPGAFHDFRAASAAVMQYLHHRRIGFDLWMVTRIAGVEDHGFGIAPGSVFRWADTFCIEMVRLVPVLTSVWIFLVASR